MNLMVRGWGAVCKRERERERERESMRVRGWVAVREKSKDILLRVERKLIKKYKKKSRKYDCIVP